MASFFPLARGHRILTFPALLLVILSILWTFFVQPNDWGLLIFSLVVFGFFIQFFRDPERIPESDDPAMVVTPADGVLFEIDQESDPRTTIFRIRMRFWDVHVNRMPTTGTLLSIEKKKGTFLPILPGLNKFSKKQNARKILLFESENGSQFKVVLISGTLAYRTVPYGKPKDFFERGDRIGIIRMGSETDLHLSTDVIKVLVKVGTKVKAGQTILAKYV